eukprot:1741880-Prymnesium_polylepis.1
MGDLYASAVGTTVLQIKEIPMRPTEYDSVLCLFGVLEGVDAAKIRAALERFGAIEGIDVSASPVIVRFSTHDAARAARRAAAELVHICAGVDTLYNERSYDGRKGEDCLEDDEGRG